MNVLALCAGVGGLELGVQIAVPGARTVAYVEREAHAAATLVARMEDGTLDHAPVWSDLATFDACPWAGAVDCVVSGDPCQPNSVAGNRQGADDDRFLIACVVEIFEASGAWRLFRENVPGNAGGQLAALVPPLERLGCRVAAGIFSAEGAGGAHRRERLFIMAERGEEGRRPDREGKMADGDHGHDHGGRQRGPRGGCEPANGGARMADAECSRSQNVSELSPQGRKSDAGYGGGADMGNTTGDLRRASGHGGPGAFDGPGDFVAYASGAGCEISEYGELSGAGRGVEGRATAELRGPWPLTAPGPASPLWPEILNIDPLAQPALGTLDLWAIARRNLGLPPLEPDTWNERGGMARGMDQAALAAAQSMVRRMADGLAGRNDRLRSAGNGVFPVAAAAAWCALDARLAAGTGTG